VPGHGTPSIMKQRIPPRVHLPSGRALRLEIARAAACTKTTLRGSVRALSGDVVALRDDLGMLVDPEGLSLEDFHVLRAVITHHGLLAEDPIDVSCDNCNRARSIEPCSVFEPGPYVDGELHDAELDEPFPFDEEHLLGTGEMKVTLAPTTVAQARPLHEAIDSGRLRVTVPLVRGMGIESLGGEKNTAKISRKLARADDATWDAVTDLFDAAHYGPRLRPFWRCDQCGARNEVEAPSLREFPAQPLARGDEPVEGFPDLDSFEAMVHRQAEPIFARLGVRNVTLLVQPEAADCDEGGVPLLGSYDPGQREQSGVPATPPEVRIYYRTFRSSFADEPFDVPKEIADTIEHEVRHHIAFLSGYDAVDDQERDEIAREEGRMVGQSESLRRATTAAKSSVADFFRRTWPVWLLVAVATVAAAIADR
jgi:hypothetical protein